jgi:hypothetical protein
MVPESPHSASGQALGYFHQCMWALVELGKRSRDEPATQLRLEALDDVQFEEAGLPTELLQTKHHISGSGSITAQSVDLWRTLNVWIDLDNRDNLVLRLVTTQSLADDSNLIYLRTDDRRDTTAATTALLLAANESTNQTSHPWRQKFIAMSDDDRIALVDRIIIEDMTPVATDLDKALRSTFRYAYPVGKEEVFVHLIKGWWAGIAVRLLSRTLRAVTGQDLHGQISEISDQLKSDSLPVDPAVMTDPDSSTSDSYRDRPFVQQLIWIALDEQRLWKAIRDYHRSYTQRSFWLRHQLLAETELNSFAFRLHDEWEQVYDSRVAAMNREGRMDRDIVGQEILEHLARDSRTRLRRRFDEPWFNRGMFHALADGELGYRVGWHPDFESKLESMLSDVTAN